MKFQYLFKARPTAESARCGRPGTIYPIVVLNAEGEDADILSELYGINAYVDHRSLYQALQFGLVNPNSKIGLDCKLEFLADPVMEAMQEGPLELNLEKPSRVQVIVVQEHGEEPSAVFELELWLKDFPCSSITVDLEPDEFHTPLPIEVRSSFMEAMFGQHLETELLSANQIIVRYEHGSVFKSYGRNAAVNNHLTGRQHVVKGIWDFSQTTTKYVGQFLGTPGKKNIQELLELGIYTEILER